MFRLHIDIPLNCSEEEAAVAANEIITRIRTILGLDGIKVDNVKVLQYRLGNDDDRQKKNYLIKDENNHVANRKSRIEIVPGSGIEYPQDD
jgi:hypothetical protein